MAIETDTYASDGNLIVEAVHWKPSEYGGGDLLVRASNFYSAPMNIHGACSLYGSKNQPLGSTEFIVDGVPPVSGANPGEALKDVVVDVVGVKRAVCRTLE
ncbi:hypothetical protein [Aurantimonas sp. VKM B-3413]|uniref:hypothetical protein n=1 Tax=Aurantimonas sp. VKM B-3413 TaxID=2779401 RepID=UPI001E596B9B|nr:hypothetical protein [Aurantimonas sp. VKM B-3413]MCB8836915.1 hypothetical protein [Aurantimonas sp. VKM B-3413]